MPNARDRWVPLPRRARLTLLTSPMCCIKGVAALCLMGSSLFVHF